MTYHNTDNDRLEIAARRAGRILVQSQLTIIGKSQNLTCKQAASTEEINRIGLPFLGIKDASDIFWFYVSLSNLLVKAYNSSQQLRKYSSDSYSKLYSRLAQVREQQTTFANLCARPLMLTAEEYENVKRPLILKKRRQRISLANILLRVLKKYSRDCLDDYKWRRKNAKLKKFLNKPVTNARILSLHQKEGLTIADSFRSAPKNYGDSLESFSEFLNEYSSLLDPIFNDEDAKELWKLVKKRGAEESFTTFYTRGRLSNHGKKYCRGIFAISIDSTSIINSFKENHPRDPRIICNSGRLSIVKDKASIPLKQFRIALKEYRASINLLKEFRNGLEKRFVPSCRYLLLVQGVLNQLAEIYSFPQLNRSEIATLDKSLDIEEFNCLLNSVCTSIQRMHPQGLIKQKTILKYLRPIHLDEINLDERQIDKLLKNCWEKPFSAKAKLTLDKLGNFLQNLSLPEEKIKCDSTACC